MSSQPHSVKSFVIVYAALLTLTASTVAVTFVHLGRWNLVAALAIAFTKASLVALIFMDVRRNSSLTKFFCVAGLLWFMILLLLTFSDYLTRSWLGNPQPW